MNRNAVPARTSSSAVDECAHDAAAVLVDDGAHTQLATARDRQDPIDPLREAPQVRQHRQQLVADQLLAVDDGRQR